MAVFPKLSAAMKRKDSNFFRSLGTYSWPSGIRVWKEKYPEDFDGVLNSTSLEWVERNADRVIINQESPVTSAG